MKRWITNLIIVSMLGLAATPLDWTVSIPSHSALQNISEDAPLRQVTGITERVSVSILGEEGDNWSEGSSISADGRYVAFASQNDYFVTEDRNGEGDVFVRDRWSGAVEVISVSSREESGNGWSKDCAISSDGRFVVFISQANNLVSADTNDPEIWDVFVRDRWAGVTELVSKSNSTEQANDDAFFITISPGGRFVGFGSDASNLVRRDKNNATDVFLRDLSKDSTRLVAMSGDGRRGNDESRSLSISADGRFVAFESASSNLVVDDTNGVTDVFVRDRQTGVTTRITQTRYLIQGNRASRSPVITADGRFVAFTSAASNLVFLDTNDFDDMFVYDRRTGVIELVSLANSGMQGNDSSWGTAISDDGRFVVFDSVASNLIDSDTNGFIDVFVHDRQTGVTELMSVSNSGEQGNDWSFGSSISADGRYVTFGSGASNLVSNDTNGAYDVFVRDRLGVFTMPLYLPLVLQ